MPGFMKKKKENKSKEKIVNKDSNFIHEEKSTTADLNLDSTDIYVGTMIDKPLVSKYSDSIDLFMVGIMNLPKIKTEVVPYIIGNVPDDKIRILIENSKDSGAPSDIV